MRLNNALIIGDAPTTAEGVVCRVRSGGYVDALNAKKLSGDKIFIPSLLMPDNKLDAAIDYFYKKKPELIVVAGDNLYDSGTIDVKYHLSPILLLHKLGLLTERTSVVGGVCIDRDEADLMGACGAKLIVCPSYSCGKGYGLPMVTIAANRIQVSLGTFDNSFNLRGDVLEEAKILYLGTSCSMRKENSLSLSFLAQAAGADDAEEFANAMGIKL